MQHPPINLAMSSSRRAWLAAAGAVAGAAALPLFAQRRAAPGAAVPAGDASAAAQPSTIGPFPADKDRVFFFFQFACGFSSMVHQAVADWAATLPPSIRFTKIHVAINDEDLAATAAHAAVRTALPKRLHEFERRAFDAIQQGARYDAQATYARVIRQLNEPVKLDKEQQGKMIGRVMRAGQLSANYKVLVVPSFGIGGALVLNANHTGGDYQALIVLVNGAVSRLLPGELK